MRFSAAVCLLGAGMCAAAGPLGKPPATRPAATRPADLPANAAIAVVIAPNGSVRIAGRARAPEQWRTTLRAERAKLLRAGRKDEDVHVKVRFTDAPRSRWGPLALLLQGCAGAEIRNIVAEDVLIALPDLGRVEPPPGAPPKPLRITRKRELGKLHGYLGDLAARKWKQVLIDAAPATRIPLLLDILRACRKAAIRPVLAAPKLDAAPGVVVRPVVPDGLALRPDGAGPRARFFGVRANPCHVVYLVDRSGSMLDTMDQVKFELLRSISRLSDEQTFHMIFFASGAPKENPPRKLIYATEDNKRAAAKYLRTVQAQGRTDPIPALRRAFEVLKSAPNRKKGKVVYLLTDGEFADNDKVVKAIRELNKRGDVCINTILHHHRSPGAMEVLKKIADANGGKFKYISPDD